MLNQDPCDNVLEAFPGINELQTQRETELGPALSGPGDQGLDKQSDPGSAEAGSKKIVGKHAPRIRSSEVVEANPNLRALPGGGAGLGSGSVKRLL